MNKKVCKIFSIIIIIMLLFCNIIPSISLAEPESQATFSIKVDSETLSGRIGVTLEVQLANGANLDTIIAELDYDKDVLEIVFDEEDDEELLYEEYNSWTPVFNGDEPGEVIMVLSRSRKTNVSGGIVKLYFDVKPNAQAQSVSFSLKDIDCAYGADSLVSDSTVNLQFPEVSTSQLSFDLNGGKLNNSTTIAPVEKMPGETYTISGTPTTTEVGYEVTFNPGTHGTLKNLSDGRKFQSKVFDKWTLKSGGGSLSGNVYTFGNTNGVAMANYKGLPVQLPDVTADDGYTFKGWYTQATGGVIVGDVGGQYSPTENTTLYAHWQANTYTVHFEGNGNTAGSMSNQTMTYGTEANLNTNSFTKEGYTFAGWNTQANGNGINYTNTQSVINLTATQDETVTLYAQWKIAQEPEEPQDPQDPQNPEEPEEIVDGGILLIERLSNIAELSGKLEEGQTIVSVTDKNGNAILENAYIGTGMIIIIEENNVKTKYTIATMGDLNGDGKVSVTDLSTVSQAILGKVALSGEYFLAGDLDNSQTISVTDLSTVSQIILGKIERR